MNLDCCRDVVADVAAPGPFQGIVAADEAVGGEGERCRCNKANGRPAKDVVFFGHMWLR